MASVCQVFVIALGLLCTVQADGLSRRRPKSACPRYRDDQAPATFYYLVREWPETYCEGHECSEQPPSKWTIHGLWPNYNRNGYPTCCAGKPRFDRDALEDLEPRLESDWPSLSENEYDFWDHEYEKHATCNIDGLDEHDYFEKTLDLDDKYSIQAALESANIVPSDDATYATSDLENALASAWGGPKPVIQCQCPNREKQCDTGTIDVIYACIDQGLKLGDCTYDCEGEGCERTNCNSVQYPPRRRGRRGGAASNVTTA